MATPSSALEPRIQQLLPELERVYTDIYAHPELSVQETRTATSQSSGFVQRESWLIPDPKDLRLVEVRVI